MQLATIGPAYQTYSLEPAHQGKPVHGVRFNPSLLASVGFDGCVHFWSTFGDFPRAGSTELSNRPCLQVDFYDRGRACGVASADGNVYLVETSEDFRKLATLSGHQSYVNGICNMGEASLISSSDDYTVRIWDVRLEENTVTFDLNREALSVAWSEVHPNQVFCGGLDSLIRCYDPRKPTSELFVMRRHSDMVTGLSLSKDGRELLSSSLDGTVILWDAAPFSPRPDRLINQIPHGLPALDSVSDRGLLRCAFTPDGRYFAAGSGSTSQFTVCMWDAKGNPFKAFKGHDGFVNEVAFHPQEMIMASCGMDGRIIVGGYL